MIHRISCSILGCGWLGLPLGQQLVEEGAQVKGATTRSFKLEKLQQASIQPYLIEVAADHISGDIMSFLQSDLLVLNIPPGRRNPDVETRYPAMIRQVMDRVTQSDIRQVLFVSSTSVYKSDQEVLTEETVLKPQTASGRALVEAENIVRQAYPSATILRLGGLIGKDRHPVKYLRGKKELRGANEAVNLIHLTDCIGLIKAIIHQEAWREIFNGVGSAHPTRAAYYRDVALRLGWEPPEFVHDDQPIRKKVSNEKSRIILGYTYQYASPYDIWQDKTLVQYLLSNKA